MLRISTMTDDGQTIRLKVEGRVVGDWVPELDQVCGSCLSQKKQIILHFSDVAYIDRRGIEALKALKGIQGERVQIVGCSLLIRALLGSDWPWKSQVGHEEGGKLCGVRDVTG